MYKLVAHRGYPEKYPENTLIGIKAAVEAGAKAVEFDVQCSADGTAYVFHDESTERLTGAAHIIHDISDETVNRLSAHYPARFDSQYHPTPISTLEEVCRFLSLHPDVEVFIEPKSHSIEKLGVEKMMTQILNDSACLSSAQRRMISFHHEALAFARSNGCPVINWVIRDFSEATQRIAETLQPDMLCVDIKRIQEPLPQWDDAIWMVYPVDDKTQFQTYANWGAHYIETDAIGRML